jgi:hypothetical protein
VDKEVFITFEIKEELKKVPIIIIIKEEVFDIKEEVEKDSYYIYGQGGGKKAGKNRNNVKKIKYKYTKASTSI